MTRPRRSAYYDVDKDLAMVANMELLDGIAKVVVGDRIPSGSRNTMEVLHGRS